MNLANKLTMSRIALSLVIIVLLLFPFEQIGFNFPSLVLDGRIMMDTKYLIAGVIFIIASLTDYFDGIVASMGEAYAEGLKAMTPYWIIPVMIVYTIAAAVVGGLVAGKMNKKHFEKAGIA